MTSSSFNDFLPTMISVQGGIFLMGSETGRDSEKPVREVLIDNFELAQIPVNQALWIAVMGENPSKFKGHFRPVERVSWDMVQQFIAKLNKELGESFRLPSEAEWEYAARGGVHLSDFLYAGSNRLEEVGWFHGNSHGETKPLGLKLPNALGFYDMSGNVWEWCQDKWHNHYKHAPLSSQAWETGDSVARVVRGGTWFDDSQYCQISFRSLYHPTLTHFNMGCRLSRTP